MRKRSKKLVSLIISGILTAVSITSLVGCHSHTYTEEFNYDDNYHWRDATCEHTDEIADYAEHDFAGWEVIIEPTCTEDGTKKNSCNTCDYAIYGLVDRLGHDFIEQSQIDPTCTSEGQLPHFYCKRCLRFYEDEDGVTELFDLTIAKVPHTYVKNNCTVCDKCYIRVDDTGVENNLGEYILYGYYPQTKVSDATLVQNLNTLAGDYTGENWNTFSYYAEGVLSNNSYYTDVNLDGETYRGVHFTAYRPINVDGMAIADNSFQTSRGYTINVNYWFKYEPLKWYVLSENGISVEMICTTVIDSQQFDYDGENSSNDYLNSTIRSWLNNTFINALTQNEQGSIIDSVVGASQVDKVALLDFYDGYLYEQRGKEVFVNKDASDYAKAQGYSVGWWTLSTAEGGYVTIGGMDNSISNGQVTNTSLGVCPVITLKLFQE